MKINFFHLYYFFITSSFYIIYSIVLKSYFWVLIVIFNYNWNVLYFIKPHAIPKQGMLSCYLYNMRDNFVMINSRQWLIEEVIKEEILIKYL